MEIVLHEIPIREIVDGYQDHQEAGVVGYGGKLDIRPPYQREFVYKDKQRDAVIDTVNHKFPLNVMYWMVKENDGGFEVLDGQQRTLSICQYVNGDYSINERYFHNLTKDEQEKILDYKLSIYWCEGTDSERLAWFEVVNTAGERLFPQELLNAIYSGPWLTDAKLKFSKRNCVAYRLANDKGALLDGDPNRQEYLEQALDWISSGNTKDYMAKHQPDANADELWNYFQSVIAWVRKLFPHHRKPMNKVPWGRLYNVYKSGKFDPAELEKQVAKLIEDEDVSNKSGIYPYLFTHDERFLNIRAFTPKMKQEAYARQKGICPACKKHYNIDEMEADHIDPWHSGGKTEAKNCQMLCKPDNRRKGGK